jgi:hypothetical protein
MMKILAIDPGNIRSAYVLLHEDGTPAAKGRVSNEDMRRILLEPVTNLGAVGAMIDAIAIEMIASYGMAVGKEVFETCVWIGRFLECSQDIWPVSFVYRKDVKLHLCNSPRAKDSNVRQALIDRFGGRDAAIGSKKIKKVGPLYGYAEDEWAALAVAVYRHDMHVAA